MAGKTEEKSTKSNTRININSMLVGVAATVLFIIASINPQILKNEFWLTMQLVLITPLLITSSLAYSKLGYKKEGKKWNTFAWVCFVVGFAFMINATAILMSSLGMLLIGVLLIFVNLLLTMIYAVFDHKYGDGSILEETAKYSLFFIVQIIFGMGVIFNWI
ncbi:MAG: hypothetical protein V1886_01805 [archaeon]